MTPALFLVLAFAQSAPPRAATVEPVTVWITITLPDGTTKDVSSVKFYEWNTKSITSYFIATPTACNTVPATSKPPVPVLGWVVHVGPAGEGRARIGWGRLQRTGFRGSSRTLTAETPGAVVLDRATELPDGRGLCDAIGWSLEARVESRVPQSNVIEAELWFVHKAPDGKEATQRQSIRMRNGGRGDFYFDDMTLKANVAGRTEPVTVEVFGTLHTATMTSKGQIDMTLYLTRRYINPKAIGLGIPPTVGKGEYLMTIDTGEVVSFLLPPLENDRGAFLGHRFSVRLRLKALGEN